MSSFFISDLHLDEANPYIADLFLNFLTSLTDKESNHDLFILGDFFEVWIGDDNLTPFNKKIMLSLQNATRKGLSVFIMHGNRDFLLGKQFFKFTGCTLLPDEQIINLFGTNTLLMHGDSLCLEDHHYLKFRKKSRNRFYQWLFLLKSLKKRQTIANHYRQASQHYTATAPLHIMDVTPSAVIRAMTKHHVQHLIHGHTHRPALHHLIVNEKTGTRRVLAPWHDHGTVYAKHSETEEELIILR